MKQENLKLDYSLKTCEQRTDLVKKIVKNTPPEQLTNRYLEYLSNYIIAGMTKEEKKSKKILTDNRMVTINNREDSFQRLAQKFEDCGGEDFLHGMIANDKNIIFAPKFSITEEDIKKVPGLRDLKESIKTIEKQFEKAVGKRKYLLKKQLISMYQNQYILKNSYCQPIYFSNIIKTWGNIVINENVSVNNGEIIDNSIISFFNYKHVSVLLNNYSKLKEDAWGNFWSDSYYLMEDLDHLIEKTLKYDYPHLYQLLISKIDNKKNIEVRQDLIDNCDTQYTVEYISNLWTNKIPKLIAETAKKEYLNWYYTIKEKGKWKRCSKCGQIKLAHSIFFSKNNTSKDGYYSICKECRNKKKVKK